MSRAFHLAPERQNELLREAAARRTTAQLSCNLPGGWEIFKTRFLGIDHEHFRIFLEYPGNPGQPPPELQPEQNVGISFRHGSHKCVFATSVVDRLQLAGRHGKHRPALCVRWPDVMQELQRRLYYRTAVPRQVMIPVDLWNLEDRAGTGAPGPVRGRIVDVSAGGLSVTLAPQAGDLFGRNTSLQCRFTTGGIEPPLELQARLRHRDTDAGGTVRLGLQFVGLDSTPEGQEVIRRIHQMTCRLQKLGPRGSQEAL